MIEFLIIVNLILYSTYAIYFITGKIGDYLEDKIFGKLAREEHI